MSTAVHIPLVNDDLVATLAHLAPNGAVAELRAARADATRFTQGSHDALLDPHATSLSLDERLAAASYAAHLSAAPDIAYAYRERLRAQDSAARDETLARLDRLTAADAAHVDRTSANTRLAAILSHTAALATLTSLPDRTALACLKETGLSTREIVALSQLVAFVAYQVRVVSALRALEAKE